MGNHWGSGREKESAGACAIAVRALAASAVVAMALFAAGLPSQGRHSGGTAAGSVGPVGIVPGGFPSPGHVHNAQLPGDGAEAPWTGTDGQADLTGLSGGFVADARALVPFSRTIVRTIPRDGLPQLNVASAGLPRPPQGFLMAPLEVLNSSSPFGLRVSPLTGAGGDFHLGQDYAAPCGTRVYASDSGSVRAAGWHPWGGGNRVEIDHGNGLITTYNHLEAIGVQAGDSVQVGQVIARVGTTGWSTGCHLHFETILHGKHTSPLNWRLIPISQVDQLAAIAMISFADRPPASARTNNWAIPAASDHTHTVLGGENELTVAPTPDETTVPPAGSADAEPAQPAPSTPAPTTPAPSESPTPTATDTPSETASPTETATPSESASPTETATPSETASPTETATPSETASPAVTATSDSLTTTPTAAGTPTVAVTPEPAPAATATLADPAPPPDAAPVTPVDPVSSPALPPAPAPATEPSATELASREAETAAIAPETATVTAAP
ncbi:peptidoglycan DD-metalloendopeptidase family protein [Arthrobacter sp. CDRTa11]|uniref:peptidoglycan DD-metalloendopeptidase family protein n=1 Tax=Arthrobacter sp. CDRTa11 TaxID=2651199 RepID=UPI002265A014|nr:peptidoglycan DD-metalloendopeptidase family protein [Arthrobacter sp. CDRTa11]UZX01829.1 peptidoglycan DD-metalloendopeptidase family protein [Arthrobacter sp. CDRTa11]